MVLQSHLFSGISKGLKGFSTDRVLGNGFPIDVAIGTHKHGFHSRPRQKLSIHDFLDLHFSDSTLELRPAEGNSPF